MKNIFTEHPHSIGESYIQHLTFAFSFGWNMMLGGIAGMIHAIFPFFFQKTGSNKLFHMAAFFIERTPTIDENIQGIAALIEKKQTNG